MKLSIAAIAVSLSLICPGHAQQPEIRNTTISGVVLRDDTDTPVAGAKVQLIRNGVSSITFIPAGIGVPLPPQAPGPPPPPPRPDGAGVPTPAIPSATPPASNALIAIAVDSGGFPVYTAFGNSSSPPITTTSDGEGRFTFTSVDPALYRVFAMADGYSTQEYGSRIPGYLGTGTPVVLKAGQSETNLRIRMGKTGSLSGRLTGADGSPLTSRSLVLLRPGFDSGGKISLQYGASAQTDDRGVYRFFDVTPGSYYLLAGSSARTGIAATVAALSSQTPELPLYFPGTPDFSAATSVQVKPGSESNEMNLRLDRKSYTLSGRVEGFGLGQPSITITYLNESAAWNNAATSSTILYNRRTGEFAIPGLSPGTFALGASSAGEGGTRLVSEFAYVIIDNRDVGNTVLSPASPPILSGRITAEGPGATSLDLQGIRMQVRSEVSGALIAAVAPAPDGKFQVSAIPFGEYRLSSSSLPAGFRIKGIRMIETAELSHAFNFENGAASLSVVISSESAQIAGLLKDAREKLMPNVQVFLVPDLRDRLDLYKTALTDVDGRYAFNLVPPGGYKVYAWEFLYANAYMNSSFLQSFDQEAASIHLNNSEKAALDLTLIPSRVLSDH